MPQNRVKFSNIVQNQLPQYVREEYPLIEEFLKQYYIAQEFDGAPVDLIQNIDKYISLDKTTNLIESTELRNDLQEYDKTLAYTNINDAREFFGLTQEQVTGLIINTKDIKSFSAQINYPYFIESWQERHALLFEWIKVQRLPAYIMFGLIASLSKTVMGPCAFKSFA